jgi:hypothetical protein
MDHANIGMRQGGNGAGFLLKPAQVLLILNEMSGQKLECNAAR